MKSKNNDIKNRRNMNEKHTILRASACYDDLPVLVT